MVQMIELQLTPLIQSLTYIYSDVLTLLGLVVVLFIAGGLTPFACWYGFKQVSK